MEILRAVDDQDSFNYFCIRLMSENNFLNPNWLPYNKKYNSNLFSERASIEDVSFIVIDKSKPIMGLMGFISDDKNIIDIPSCVIQSNTAKNKTIENFFLKNFDEQVLYKSKFFTLRDYLHNGTLSFIFKHLVNNGFYFKTAISRYIDLKLDETILRQSLRGSYKSIINNGLRNYKIQILDHKNIKEEDFLSFRRIHINEAGRETRSKQSWLDQFEIVKNKEGFLVSCNLDDSLIAAGFFSISKSNCIYQASACDNNNYDNIRFHSLMWQAINYAKKLGSLSFEMGDIIYSNNHSNTFSSQKELDISHFKTGFGGHDSVFIDIYNNKV